MAEDALSRVHYNGRDPVSLFETMAHAMRNPDPDAKDRLIQEAFATLHTVDATHPPTQFRITCIGALEDSLPDIRAQDIDWRQIDQELAPGFAVAQDRLLSRIIVQ